MCHDLEVYNTSIILLHESISIRGEMENELTLPELSESLLGTERSELDP